ncbi:MAG: carboxypeptidase-like regulatory domain-containing protein, partial [Mariniphaga sp.]
MKIKNSQKNRGKGLSTFFLALAFLLFGFSDIQAGINPVEQASVRISGTVTSAADGLGLPGVSIVVKGTSVGTVTNMDGNYSINVAPDATLVFSFIGFSTQEIPVQGRNTINVVMEESIEALEEVVVTALGIRREEKSLGYSVGKVSSEELSKVVNENLLTSMAGKVTGVTINSTGGAGSSVSMIIRGATSLSTDNQPLYVVDGVPMTSGVGNVGGFGRDNRVDYG